MLPVTVLELPPGVNDSVFVQVACDASVVPQVPPVDVNAPPELLMVNVNGNVTGVLFRNVYLKICGWQEEIVLEARGWLINVNGAFPPAAIAFVATHNPITHQVFFMISHPSKIKRICVRLSRSHFARLN
jgi:hypothetical protein